MVANCPALAENEYGEPVCSYDETPCREISRKSCTYSNCWEREGVFRREVDPR